MSTLWSSVTSRADSAEALVLLVVPDALFLHPAGFGVLALPLAVLAQPLRRS